MSLHIDADIFCALFLGFLCYAVKDKYIKGSYRERIFLLYLASTLITIILDIIARIVCDCNVGFSSTIITTTVYYIMLLIPVSCWLIYIMTFTYANNTPKLDRIVNKLNYPIGLAILLLIVNIWAHWFFTSNENGDFIACTYRLIMTSFYVIPGIAAMLLIIKYRKTIDSKVLFIILLALPMFVIAGLIIQLVFPQYITAIPANSLIAFVLYIFVQNEETRKYTEQTEEKISQLQFEAEIDGMTGLLNKSTTSKMIEDSLLKNNGKLCYLMIIDMDNLKIVNDKYGHEFGDIALKRISTILKNHFRSSDIVGRIGGDEFCVFVSDIPGTEIMRKSTSILSNELHNTLEVNENTVPYHCSIGGAFGVAGEVPYDVLFRRADICLYQSKRNSKGSFTTTTVGSAIEIE